MNEYKENEQQNKVDQYEGLLKQIGGVLWDRRNEKGYTLVELGRIVHMDKSNLSNIENGDVDVRMTTLLRLCDALEITLVDVLFGCNDDLKRRVKYLAGGELQNENAENNAVQ